MKMDNKWASVQENLTVSHEQQRHRPACSSVQSDQYLYYLLCGKYGSQTCSMEDFNILAL